MRKTALLKIIGAIVSFLFLDCSSAGADIFRSFDIDEYCKKPLTARETIVYIDPAAVRSSSHDWALTILNKLNLTPRERLKILYIHEGGAVEESFNLCFPELSPEEIVSENEKRGLLTQIFDDSIEKQLRRAKDIFQNSLQRALSKIIAETGAPQESIDILKSLSLDKNLAVDEGRFSRVIILSPMISPLFSRQELKSATLADPGVVDRIYRQYPWTSPGAQVFVFGFTGTGSDYAKSDIEAFWRGYFQKGDALLNSIGSSLSVQRTDAYSAGPAYIGLWKNTQAEGRATLAFFLVKNGGALSGWLTLFGSTGAFHVPVEGMFSCEGEANCKLEGRVVSEVPPADAQPYFWKDDILELKGDSRKLSGTLTSAGPAKNSTGDRFEYKLSFEH
jgi:hypothetical protein